MEFTKALFTDERIPYLDEGVRLFRPIAIDNELFLSIQASLGHRCIPQMTLNDLSLYTHWEFALVTKDQVFLRVSNVLPEFQSLAELELHFDESVYNYVPTDLMSEVFAELQRLGDYY